MLRPQHYLETWTTGFSGFVHGVPSPHAEQLGRSGRLQIAEVIIAVLIEIRRVRRDYALPRPRLNHVPGPAASSSSKEEWQESGAFRVHADPAEMPLHNEDLGIAGK
jgi:hypothetical protein